MSEKKTCDPSWWRLGWIPYAVLPMVAAAADLCFPLIQSEGMQNLGIGAGIGVVLFIAAILILRRDFSRREQLFLGMLALVALLGLLVSGSHAVWAASLALPFFVIRFMGTAANCVDAPP